MGKQPIRWQGESGIQIASRRKTSVEMSLRTKGAMLRINYAQADMPEQVTRTLKGAAMKPVEP